MGASISRAQFDLNIELHLLIRCGEIKFNHRLNWKAFTAPDLTEDRRVLGFVNAKPDPQHSPFLVPTNSCWEKSKFPFPCKYI